MPRVNERASRVSPVPHRVIRSTISLSGFVPRVGDRRQKGKRRKKNSVKWIESIAPTSCVFFLLSSFFHPSTRLVRAGAKPFAPSLVTYVTRSYINNYSCRRYNSREIINGSRRALPPCTGYERSWWTVSNFNDPNIDRTSIQC